MNGIRAHRRRGLRLASFAIAPICLIACGDDAEETPTTDSSGTELANPASVFCVEQGGTVDIVDQAGGQAGVCVLPDGTRVDEWEYFREHAGTTPTEP